MTKSYDLRLHTHMSPCSRNAPETVVERALAAQLDGIAVTDHDTIEGAELVADLAPPELDVIISADITTSQGHLLALDIKETPPVGTDPVTAIEFIHEQDGIAILAHPFDSLRQTYTSNLEAIAESVDAVEVKNSRCVFSRYNSRAQGFAEKHDLPVVGGSDAHFPIEIGRAC